MPDAKEKLKTEFNQWAEQGRGEEMEANHGGIARQTIALMPLKPGDRVLDLSCGTGWVTRLLAEAVEGGQGIAVGTDLSDEMIARARAASRSVDNVLFTAAAADEIPWRDEYFEQVLSVESFYYYPDQEAVLREVHRVLIPGGGIFIVINLYKENPYSMRLVEQLKVPVHVRSESEYEQMLRTQGFVDVAISHIPNLDASPGGSSFASDDELREFQRIGALLLVARKP